MKYQIIKQTSVCIMALLVMTSCEKKEDYDATGIFEATTVTLSSESTGKILSFCVEEGDSVEASEVLGSIDATILALQYSQVNSQQSSATTSLPDVEAQTASLRAEIEHQKSECARLTRLLADGAATQKQSDDAMARLRTLKAQLDGVLSSLGKSRMSIYDNAAAMQYQKEQIKEQIGRCMIKSPISGTVLAKYAEAGEFISLGRPLLKLADLSRFYLRAYFTVSQLADLRLGQQVTVIADFGGDKKYEYPGKITWISDESEFTPKSIQTSDSRSNLVYAVKISVKNDGRLKIGQYGEVRL